MELHQIRYTLSVAKERSFTRAAARLHVSQSAVSAQVRLLENEIGFPIFRRGTRGVELTEAGRTFLHEAERIIADLLNLSATAQRLRGGGVEMLNLGMVSGAAQIFGALMSQELAAFDDIVVRIVNLRTRKIFDELYDEHIDAGIAIESDPNRIPGGLIFERLATVDMKLIVHAKHALARGRSPIEVSALGSQPIIMNELEIGYGQIVMSLFSDLGIRPKIFAITDNIEIIKVIVQSGIAVAIIPDACARQEIACHLLKSLPIRPKREVPFSLVRRRESLSRQKETFLSRLVGALRVL